MGSVPHRSGEFLILPYVLIHGMGSVRAAAVASIAVALVALSAYAALASQSPGTVMGTLINSLMSGISAELRSPSLGPQVRAGLQESMGYLETAWTLYSEGNYTGAQAYLEMAMAIDGEALLRAGGPSGVQPGLSESREVALAYAQKLYAVASSISNATLRQEVLSQISSATSLLRSTGNSSQEALNLAEARQLLGEANSEVNSYAREELASGLRAEVAAMRASSGLTGQAATAYEYSLNSISMQAGGENFAQIYNELRDAWSGEIPDGTIGVYGDAVIVVTRWPLPALQIGGYGFAAAGMVEPEGAGPEAQLMQLPRIVAAWDNASGAATVVGIVNGTGLYSYVESSAGGDLVVFSPLTPRGGRVPAVVLYDVGNYTSEPTGNLTVYYEPVPVGELEALGAGEFNDTLFLGSLRHVFVVEVHDHHVEVRMGNETLEVGRGNGGRGLHARIFGNGTDEMLTWSGGAQPPALAGNWTGPSGRVLEFGAYVHKDHVYIVLPSRCSDLGGISVLGENFSVGGPLMRRSMPVVVAALGSADLAGELWGSGHVQVTLYCGTQEETVTLNVENSSAALPYNLVLYEQGSVMPY